MKEFPTYFVFSTLIMIAIEISPLPLGWMYTWWGCIVGAIIIGVLMHWTVHPVEPEPDATNRD